MCLLRHLLDRLQPEPIRFAVGRHDFEAVAGRLPSKQALVDEWQHGNPMREVAIVLGSK